jgi:hydroxyacylglutathione hydrolase
VWLTEGHLNGHISFVWGAQQELLHACTEEHSPALFCGDTLFAGGCGYVFDGPMATMATSLEHLASLPPSTWVCCAHEYTLDNLHFALSVEPNNQALKARVARVIALREVGGCAVPSRLSEELESNPFVRAVMGTLHSSTSLDTQPLDTQLLSGVGQSAAERFERMRRLKDSKVYRERPLNALISRD